MWSGNLKTALASLRVSKWRSLLTMLGVIIGVSSVITVVSLGEGLKDQVVGQISRLSPSTLSVRSGKLVDRGGGGNINGVNLLAFSNTSTLTDQDVNSIQKLKSVKAVAPMTFVTSSASADNGSSDSLYIIGTTSGLPETMTQKLHFGDFFRPQDEDEAFAIIGAGVAHQLFGDASPIGQSMQIMGQDFIVHGVLSETPGGVLSIAETNFNAAVFIPYQSAKDLTNNQTNILQILIQPQDPNNPDQAIKQIHATLLRNHFGQENFTVLKRSELLRVANNSVNTITGFISGIAAISLLVGGIGIMDIMLVSVSERTREIGIRKAIGATNRQILNQFLTEGLALSIGGGIIGIIAAALIYAGLKIYTGLNPVITVPVVILAVGISVSVGIIFSVAPAVKASRKNPIDALRGE